MADSMSVSLTLDQVKERARRAPMVPIFRDMLSDALTPVTAFAALAADGPAYLLESVERGEQLGRYSFVAADPMAIVSIADGRATVQDANGVVESFGFNLPTCGGGPSQSRSGDLSGPVHPPSIGTKRRQPARCCSATASRLLIAGRRR